MACFFINIGSNLGNRRLNLSRAMKAVADEFGDFEMSHVVESKPWGFDSTNSFLNIGICFSSEAEPEAVLQKLQGIEKVLSPASHRDTSGGYCDREVDIDIVAVDRESISSPKLTVPHPCLAERDFFLVPMEELAPSWTHPDTGLTPTEMLSALEKRTEKSGRDES